MISGQLVPKAVRWRVKAEPDERMTISQTIVDYVLEKGEGVITTDAPTDKRFSPAQSIVDYQIREAICVPIQGRHTTLGVLYSDIQSSFAAAFAGGEKPGQTRPLQPGASDGHGRDRPPGRPGDRKYRSFTTTRSRRKGWPPSARRSPPFPITSRTFSRASAAAAI